jgi:hypothetical protein
VNSFPGAAFVAGEIHLSATGAAVHYACALSLSRGDCAPHRIHQLPRNTMNVTLAIAPLISLIAGILILVMPKLLNYIIALYLIIIGIIGLVK